MIKLEYDAQESGMRVSFVVPDCQFATAPVETLLGLCTGTEEDRIRLVPQTFETLDAIARIAKNSRGRL